MKITKNIKKLKLFFIGFSCFLQVPLMANTAVDQYKQMGGISAIAEQCLGEDELGYALSEALLKTVIENPSTVGTIESLYNTYVNAYNKSMNDYKIWIGSQQSYNKSAFSCDDANDMETIKKYSSSMTENLRK